MQIVVISLFPEMFSALTEYGITGRAVTKGLLELSVLNPRDFTEDRHRTVDDKPYGGGPGMVMKPEPLKKALAAAKERLGTDAKVVYLSPQGQQLTQAAVEDFSVCDCLVLIAGRYEGIDERFISRYVDEEWSVGDYVLSGGELPAMVLADAVTRLLPGALGDEQSAVEDSFSNGLLDFPHYTRPEEFEAEQVPAVLLSGDHEKIRRWRLQQSVSRTKERRPDLLADAELSAEQSAVLKDLSRNGDKERS